MAAQTKGREMPAKEKSVEQSIEKLVADKNIAEAAVVTGAVCGVAAILAVAVTISIAIWPSEHSFINRNRIADCPACACGR